MAGHDFRKGQDGWANRLRNAKALFKLDGALIYLLDGALIYLLRNLQCYNPDIGSPANGVVCIHQYYHMGKIRQ